MSHIHHASRYFALGLILALISGLLMTGWAQAAQAAREDRPDSTLGRDRAAPAQGARDDRPIAGPIRDRPAPAQGVRDDRPIAGPVRDRPAPAQGVRDDRPIAGPVRDRPAPAQALRADGPVRITGQNEFRDTRYQHDRVYPVRGHVVRSLPRNHRVVVHGGARYYFSGGAWYRPYGPRFSIVAPPFGLFVPFLPPYYATVWVGARPYYYANEIYYAHRGDGYVVVEPPASDVSQAPPPADQLFIYPRHNQSEPQQATDRYECHSWAVNQTGFDPTRLPGDASQTQMGEKRADYQRAMSACLDGRGYTVK
jgi:hypothetical protein